jgi:hypothetical protein
VLWDLSYILENSFRMSLGDIPYRDFPFPFAPLTFLVQAIIIKLTGRVFWHHILYCAVAGGLATVTTWRILLNILNDAGRYARLMAFLLSLPLTVLGIYCIFPHPFYDPDCTLAILLCILLLQQLEQRRFPPLRSFLTGAALVVPLFVKQNMGLAFLLSTGLAFLLIGIRRRLGGLRPQYGWLAIGMGAGLAAAFSAIQCTAGLGNYYQWTIRFAAARRMPPLANMAGIYQDYALLWWSAAFFLGVSLLRFNRQRRTALDLLSVCLMAPSFCWTVIDLFFDEDAPEHAEQLLALWPFLMVVAALFFVFSLRRRTELGLALPIILIGTVHGAFLSQQLWGSTYAIWPLLLLLFATAISALFMLLNDPPHRAMLQLTVIVAVSLLISGGFYVWSRERLRYANLSDGEMVRSKFPALRGLSIRGPWIPDFEELVQFAKHRIPEQDGLLIIPGEDLFYYTTGRHPHSPVLLFDHTVNPFTPEEIRDISRTRNIRWLIVKRDL